jgi:hypothetical protein
LRNFLNLPSISRDARTRERHSSRIIIPQPRGRAATMTTTTSGEQTTYKRYLRYPVLIPAINCPPFTIVYCITRGDINFIKRAPLAHGRSTAISQLPRASRRNRGDAARCSAAWTTGKKPRHVQMALGRARRVHGIPLVTTGATCSFRCIERTTLAREESTFRKCMFYS